MAQNRYRLNGSSLAELGARAIREYGPSARIVASEKIPAKGLGGFLGRHYYQAAVEVIDVDETGAARSEWGRPEAARPQDEGPEFAEMIDQLRRALRDPGPDTIAAARSRAPAPLRAAGALVVVTGLGSDAEAAASGLGLEGAVMWDLATRAGCTLRELKRHLLHARAGAVAQHLPVLAIVPLAFPQPGVRSGADHPIIRDADQLWVAVDVSRKVEDTRRWLSVVAENRGVDGALLVGGDRTLTPDTGRQLGLPVYHTAAPLE